MNPPPHALFMCPVAEIRYCSLSPQYTPLMLTIDQVHSVVLHRGEERLERGCVYHMEDMRRQPKNSLYMSALSQTDECLVAGGNGGVCVFRKGEPSASLKVQETGWVDFSINRPKNWLATSCRREPNKVSIYDIGESKLVSTLEIRTHLPSLIPKESIQLMVFLSCRARSARTHFSGRLSHHWYDCTGREVIFSTN
jgi:hypothetical protein